MKLSFITRSLQPRRLSWNVINELSTGDFGTSRADIPHIMATIAPLVSTALVTCRYQIEYQT